MMSGEDVFALQHGLRTLGYLVDADGFFGGETDKLVRFFQRTLGLVADGKAGGLTQKTVAMLIAADVASELRVPVEAPKGQLEHESGFRLGNYSSARSDGTFDAGVAQRNTKFTPPKEGFRPGPSIVVLLNSTREHFNLFEGVKPLKRRWALAQGAWNAPAFACFLAREEGATKVTRAMTLQPSTASRQTFEAYVANVSKYLTV